MSTQVKKFDQKISRLNIFKLSYFLQRTYRVDILAETHFVECKINIQWKNERVDLFKFGKFDGCFIIYLAREFCCSYSR